MKMTVSILLLLTALTIYSDDAAKELTIELRCKTDRGPKPLVAVWLETEDGTFVQTLQRYGRRAKYFKTLSEWTSAAKKEPKQHVDAVTSATIRWRRTATLTLPVKTEAYDLTTGKYVIRIESRAEKKKHYTDFKIPSADALKGGTFKHDGHVEIVKITAN